MSILASYFLLGLSLAAPIGPINAAQIDRGIKFGFFHAWILGVGAILADAIYMLIVYIGVVQFIDTPFMKSFLWSFGAFILIYTGIEGLAGAGKLELKDNRKPEPLWQAFLYGFFMSLSNPLTILFWLGIYGAVLAKTASTVGNNELILYSCAIFIGLITWDIWMAAISSSFRRFLHIGILKFISIISGVSLIGFGVYFGYQAIQTIFF